MLENHKASLKHNHFNSSSLKGMKFKNMNSMMHTSSQFDKYASTIDGTQVSLQHYQVSMRSEVDPAEQAHNNMNLALGKPT
jgi:hypothetical protein